ncbi:MAG: winged helix-turn-helix transcriptional regulator [Candidatus Diapherotrites archaeon]|nr:winged helix-turn-helix transcriptional regulator [Candidatus Diapherotrites archaeon]
MTFKVVSAILRKKSFSQTELAKETGVSWGQMNKIVRWLVKKGFVRKARKYELINPTALISLLATEIELEKHSFEISVQPKAVLSWVKKSKGVLCLTSALQFYSNYFRDPSINLYYSKELEDYLQNAKSGITKVFLVKSNLHLSESEVARKGGFLLTNEIRTIIDLFADKKAYATEPLLKKL